MRYFDTARAYSDSEEKVGEAFAGGLRDEIVLATKTQAKTPAEFREQLETSLRTLRTDRIDVYQFHCVGQCWRPGDGSGMYEEMLAAKAAGKIRHVCVTTHLIAVAEECVDSGLYDTLQFPFSYLASDREVALVKRCEAANVGFIAMKRLAGGLITRSDAAMPFISQFPNVVPIWGVQRERELDEWLSYMADTPSMTPERRALVERDRKELAGSFCRGCGYCMPCPAGIQINNCARMSQMIRRSPSANFLSEEWQGLMGKIEDCIDCGLCKSRCPYGLDTPNLLRKNLADYKDIISGKTKI
jgi:predicted aldo/keto reductase-like oxidoreductase